MKKIMYPIIALIVLSVIDTFAKDGYIVRLTIDGGWEDNSFDGRVFHKHNGTNFYLTDSNEKYLYLIKGSD